MPSHIRREDTTVRGWFLGNDVAAGRLVGNIRKMIAGPSFSRTTVFIMKKWKTGTSMESFIIAR